MTQTQEIAAVLGADRDKRRGEQALPPFHQLDSKQKVLVLEAERADLLKTTQLTQRLSAWPLERYPLSVYHAPSSGVLLLPRHYRAEFGCDQVSRGLFDLTSKMTNVLQLKFREGDNLNLLTYCYYDERIDTPSYSGNNFVADGGIQPRRSVYFHLFWPISGLIALKQTWIPWSFPQSGRISFHSRPGRDRLLGWSFKDCLDRSA